MTGKWTTLTQPSLPLAAKHQSSSPDGTLESKLGIGAGARGELSPRNTVDVMGAQTLTKETLIRAQLRLYSLVERGSHLLLNGQGWVGQPEAWNYLDSS